MIDVNEIGLVIELAGRLDESPKKNWVENAGGLPKYIEDIAVALKKDGKTTSEAISIAVSRVKVWAAGGGKVDADTKAKAAAAVAQWEKLKAKAHASSKKVAASAGEYADYDLVIGLSSTSFNVDRIRQAWDSTERVRRQTARAARRAAGQDGYGYDGMDIDSDYRSVRETWSDFLIISSGYDAAARYWKVPYTVSDAGEVNFGAESEVKVEYTANTSDVSPTIAASRPLTATERLAVATGADPLALGLSATHPEVVQLTRHVKTAEGARLFGQPIGSVITADKLAAMKKTVGHAGVRKVTGRGEGDITHRIVADNHVRLNQADRKKMVEGKKPPTAEQVDKHYLGSELHDDHVSSLKPGHVFYDQNHEGKTVGPHTVTAVHGDHKSPEVTVHYKDHKGKDQSKTWDQDRSGYVSTLPKSKETPAADPKKSIKAALADRHRKSAGTGETTKQRLAREHRESRKK